MMNEHIHPLFRRLLDQIASVPQSPDITIALYPGAEGNGYHAGFTAAIVGNMDAPPIVIEDADCGTTDELERYIEP